MATTHTITSHSFWNYYLANLASCFVISNILLTSLPIGIKLYPNITSNSSVANPIIFGEGFGVISDITVDPDGYLYVVSIVNGKIYKIIPNQ